MTSLNSGVMLQVGDRVVYPAHGVGEIVAIENREVEGRNRKCYVLRIIENGMKILIQADRIHQVRLREVVGESEVGEVFSILRERQLETESISYNKRYSQYIEKIKSGDIFEIAAMVRDLFLLRRKRNLDFAELKLLDVAYGLLIQELAIAQGCHKDDADSALKEIFRGA